MNDNTGNQPKVTQEYSIQEVAKLAGTTSRTLRHYADVGLLEPSRIGHNGYRYYNENALVRLQRILLLRELGLSLPAIAKVLDREDQLVPALTTHIELLKQEQDRIERQIASVQRTKTVLEQNGEFIVEQMFDGFDHNQYKDEVEQRWGKAAYQQSSDWWESKTPTDKREFQNRVADLNERWIELAAKGEDPASPASQAQAEAHFAWLTSVPGTPAASGDSAATQQYVAGLAQMYVDDERFAANYGGKQGAEFVQQALTIYCDRL